MKMNNKGFAISSLLYGLLLVAFLIVAVLMSIMQSNRHNTSTLVERIEEELNRYSRTSTTFEYIPSSDPTNPVAQEYIVPYGKAGWYRIELWGAGREASETLGNTGRGSYVSSMVYLPENQHIYFYIGENGNGTDKGRSTSVRTVSGGNTSESKKSIFMLAGGGGKKDEYTGEGYNDLTGGTGIRTKSSKYDSSTGEYKNLYWEGESFVSGYPGVNAVAADGTKSNNTNSPAKFGIIRDDFTPDGTLITLDDAEKQALDEADSTTFAMQTIIPAVNAGHGRAKIELVSQNKADVLPTTKNMYDAKNFGVLEKGKIKGVRFQFENILNQTNGGNELISEIQFIQPNGSNYFRILKANGSLQYVLNKSNYKDDTNKKAATDGLVDEISRGSNTATNYQGGYVLSNAMGKAITTAAAFPTLISSTDTTSVIQNANGSGNYSTVNIYVTFTSGGEQKVATIRKITADERTNGIKVSNYVLSFNETVPTANYFITPRAVTCPDNGSSCVTVNYTKALTATDSEGRFVEYDFYNANRNQQWLIQQVGTANDDGQTRPIYKIVENQNNYALQPHDQGKEVGEFVSTSDGEYTGKLWQHWFIIRQPNGYYQIKSVSAQEGYDETNDVAILPNFVNNGDADNLCLTTRQGTNTDYILNGLMTLAPCVTDGNDTSGNGAQFFKLTPIDY